MAASCKRYDPTGVFPRSDMTIGPPTSARIVRHENSSVLIRRYALSTWVDDGKCKERP